MKNRILKSSTIEYIGRDPQVSPSSAAACSGYVFLTENS